METKMDTTSFEGYKSASQKIRKITEYWMSQNMYCPFCGCPKIEKFENNRPAADFFCPHCHEEYELKSKAGTMGSQVMDGAYQTLISRISSYNNPNFFFLGYEQKTWIVRALTMVPKYFFLPDIIIKRKPLADTARRHGWTGCNILYSAIPERGKICIIKDGHIVQPKEVIKQVKEIRFISRYGLKQRGWVLETLKCIDQIPRQEFTLEEIYQFIPELEKKYPDNHHIRAKLRQQLQILRDKGIIQFQGDGHYRKLN